MQFIHKIKKQKYYANHPKAILCTMPYLSHQFLLNKILRTTNIPKSYAVCNIKDECVVNTSEPTIWTCFIL